MNKNTTKKTTQGRQKTEIKRIENVSSRQVTFSKRRAGLFKKASELCILSGAEVAVIVNSPGKRTFAFGHPSVDAIIDRYLNENSSAPPPAAASDNHFSRHEEFNQHYDEISKQLEAERKRTALIEESKVGNGGVTVGGFWWDEAVDELGLEELVQYMEAMEELKKNVAMRADELMLMKASSILSPSSINPPSLINPGGGGGLMADHLIINQSHDCNANSFVPHGFDFGRVQF